MKRDNTDIFFAMHATKYPGVSESEIQKEELAVGHTFPSLFRQILRTRNGGPVRDGEVCIADAMDVELSQFCGVGKVPMSIYVSMCSFEGRQDGFVPFGMSGQTFFCFDYNTLTSSGEPSIVFFDRELDEVVPICSTFTEFLDLLSTDDEVD